MQSVNNSSDDSAKTLAEKLALSRELALLKPEIDHLRSQVEHQKDVLAEKLALERQLNSLEIELATEKRATQKATQLQERKDNAIEDELKERIVELEKANQRQSQASNDVEKELRKQIACLEKNLASEKKASEKAQKTTQKVPSDTEENLRQQVADLEKKLADEKRVAKKAKRSQESNDKQAQTEVQEKIAELENQLASERQDHGRTRSTSEKEAAAAQERIDDLTQRVDEFKTKLRETRAELKGVRAELTAARTTTTKISLKEDGPTKKPQAKPKAGKKRGANEISLAEPMLDTPGNDEGRVKRPLKKKGIEFTAVGEKSEFSITPFLKDKTTINVSETIEEEEEEEEPSILVGKGDSAAPIIEPEAETVEEVLAETEKPATKSVAKTLKSTKPKATEKKSRSKAKGAMLIQASSHTNIRTVSATEDKDGGESETVGIGNVQTGAATEGRAKAAEAPDTNIDNPEPKKKKRKLHGITAKGTIFDQDEDAGEAVAPVPTAATAAVKRKPVALKSGARKGPVSALARTGAFGEKTFSPLKKDRRGVGASFLA